MRRAIRGGLFSIAVGVLTLGASSCKSHASPALRPSILSPAAARAHGLVLYDDGGPYGWLGELYATGAGVLVSHFAEWQAMPISAYRRGAMKGYEAAIYIGSTFDQPLPIAFTDDVLAETTPLVWIGNNIWQLPKRSPDFTRRFGFQPATFDKGPFHVVSYKGIDLARQADDTAGVMSYGAVDEAVATVLAWARRDDGTRVPWALRTRRFTYIGENPLAYVTTSDRYLAFCDLLFDVFATRTQPRHRALVRIEDVSPHSSPAAIREIAERLSRRNVPFSLALVPVYVNPKNKERVRLADVPELTAALRHAVERGGTLVLHGYTHQYEEEPNPSSGITGDDFEFYRAHLDADRVVLDGPVRNDSATWASHRIDLALGDIASVGLPRPRAFEYPHYAGSPVDSRAIARQLDVAFQRETFFGGALAGANEDTTRPLGLVFPYVVKDVYGWTVVPENLGNYVAPAQGEAQTPEQIVARARALLAVRDGVAGFFFHPFYDPAILEQIVDGITGAGYTFVSVDSLVR